MIKELLCTEAPYHNERKPSSTAFQNPHRAEIEGSSLEILNGSAISSFCFRRMAGRAPDDSYDW
jgi:hypothetical protein